MTALFDGGPTESNRREYLTGLTTAGSLALAGCLGDDSSDDEQNETESYDDVDEERRIDGEILRSSFPIRLYDTNSKERVSEVHWHTEFSHWHFVPFEIPLEEYRPVNARVYNAESEVLPLGSDEQFHIRAVRTEDTPADLLEVKVTGKLLNFHGLSAGEGKLLFELLSGDTVVWTTPVLTVTVGNTTNES
ncbi:hypothetical protein ACFQJ7_07460 [Halovenus rubra]|uniref:Uncharacterized protein n=2 Tax=Halovenus rubra TaxID=869890 RepID=A0ACC7E3S0_9EURY|nr:hypothetical protein [Halovenus rubra]